MGQHGQAPSDADTGAAIGYMATQARKEQDRLWAMIQAERKRVAELESALDEIRGAAYHMSKARNGSVQTMCVPIGAWDNAMRVIARS